MTYKLCVYCEGKIDREDWERTNLKATDWAWNTLQYCSIKCRQYACLKRKKERNKIKYL
jgi:hypothetical protein